MATTYKIGEASALLNLKTYVLRFWETEFPHIAPLRTDKGQRLYTGEHLALLERIRFLLHERGLTIEGARKVLNEDKEKGVVYGFAPAADGRPAPAHGPEPEREAQADAESVDLGEESADPPDDSDNALSAAGTAVNAFLSQHKLPGISTSCPVYEQPLFELPVLYYKGEQAVAARRHERCAAASDRAAADSAVCAGNGLAAGHKAFSLRSQGASRSLLRDLSMELEAIAGFLRNGGS
jgi:DNA-binding transcriptional MerR regulator